MWFSQRAQNYDDIIIEISQSHSKLIDFALNESLINFFQFMTVLQIIQEKQTQNEFI